MHFKIKKKKKCFFRKSKNNWNIFYPDPTVLLIWKYKWKW